MTPWPPPQRPWAMCMRWHDLLFLHWPVPVRWLRDYIPPALALETFDGAAWVGVVPFHMSHVHPRGVPPLPGFSAFPELNVRTYVTIEGKPGVWFFSLDAANPIAVRAARLGFHLPYYDADMEVALSGDQVSYRSARTHRGAPPAEFCGRYRPDGAPFYAVPGTIEHWFTERYCLYAADRRGRVWRCDIVHRPWPLQAAQAEIETNSMTCQLGFDLPPARPIAHFARYQIVFAWMLERVV